MNPLQPKNMSTEIILWVLAIGLGAGILSGMVGIGGGLVMVPALVFFLNYSQHQAQGTSLAVLTLPVVILGALTYYQKCQQMGTPIDLKVVGLLAVTFIIGGFLGSKIALAIDGPTLKKYFAILLFYSGFKMMNWDQAIFKWIKSLFN